MKVLVLSLLCGLILLVSGVVIVARLVVSQDPLTVLGFGWCGDIPCFLGIVPGKTTWQEVQDLTGASDARHLAYFSMTFRRELLLASAGNPAGIENTGGPTSVGMTLSDPSSRLGDVLLLYGTPCNAILGTAGKLPTVTLIYPQAMFRASLERNQSIAHAALIQAGLTPMSCVSKTQYAWHGFQSLRRFWLSQFAEN